MHIKRTHPIKFSDTAVAANAKNLIRFATIATVILFVGCSNPTEPNAKVEKVERERAPNIERAPAKIEDYGVFTKNASSMPIKDSYAVWIEKENKLKIYQTPTKLTDEDKTSIRNGEMAFFIFSGKQSPDKLKWQWYPFVVTELTFRSSDISAENIKSFYILAFGIEENNYTDNLNSYPNEKERFEHVSFKNGVLSIEYAGESAIMESRYTWDIKI
jgi:hypothetical protein